MTEVNVVYLTSLDCPDDWEASCAFVKQWCADNKASYYCALKEDFSIQRAQDLAIQERNTTVLVESLS